MNKNIEAIYQFILAFKAEHDGNSPSIREIKRACNISSTSMVEIYLDCLIGDGKIVMINKGTNYRRIGVVGGVWTLIGPDGG
ncbi:MAG: hypothetical protein A2W25_05290 [candidate division Zixibacteria bacterium RBG_16_53_22]|nr:MAG: hypothetical protein A2W25_05290 [candidate division Zixibacteria bacterium RBG_16_53_22]